MNGLRLPGVFRPAQPLKGTATQSGEGAGDPTVHPDVKRRLVRFFQLLNCQLVRPGSAMVLEKVVAITGLKELANPFGGSDPTAPPLGDVP